MFADVIFPRLATDCLDHLPCDHVHHIRIGESAAKARRRLDEADPPDAFGTRQAAPRNEQQITGAIAQTRAVNEQVADREFASDPRIVHLEARQVVDDLIVPAKLAGINQRGERRHGDRFAG